MLIFFVVVIICAITTGILLINRKTTANYGDNTPPRGSIDSLNLGQFSQEEQDQIKAISEFCGVRYVTPENIRNYAIHNIGQDFASMPGWDIWDISVHEAPGQYERLRRALDSKICVLSYDPKYQLAKIRGNTGVYLTSCKRCSCPDYHNRHLPCKHMYALAIELGGDVEKHIIDTENKPLYGLKIALAGRFAGSKDGSDGIRGKINSLGGIWEDTVSTYSSVLVCGNAPSEIKVSYAKNNDIEILQQEAILTIFVTDLETRK